jgi:prepilin-type N-terminal cleavage/methylation domain-containing protein
MKRLRSFYSKLVADRDAGFTLIELAVSLGILLIVSSMAVTILISTRNLSSVVSWQSSSNAELRQLIDSVFSDIETARPAFGCDTNSDGRPDTTFLRTGVVGGCDISKMIERNDPVLLVAAPNRICYYTNRLRSRQVVSPNPAYVPVCLAAVNETLRLETFAPPTEGEDWNKSITTGARAPEKVQVLAAVDPASSPDGYFDYYSASGKNQDGNAGKPLNFTGTVTVATFDQTAALVDADRATVNGVVMKARLRFGSTALQKNRTRDIAYRIALRATRYSAERCGFGNVTAGDSC